MHVPLGLEAGTPIKEAAISAGVEGLYAGLPVVIFLVTFGGFMTNAAYCLQQNIKNKTGKEYFSVSRSTWINNVLFCALGGLWYSQFLDWKWVKAFLKKVRFYSLFMEFLMSLNVTFSNVWGMILKRMEGHVTNSRLWSYFPVWWYWSLLLLLWQWRKLKNTDLL